MATMWTSEQSDAIYKSGTNIIVSAGAGSGKTAVLSERVLKKVEDGINVDELLILTFTNLAAQEMKERIRKKIKKNKDLIEQLNKLDNSYITTFDSYALSLVKKYHYLLNISNPNIIEENILDLKIKEYLDSIMEEEYLEKKDDFIKFIKDFCVKDDESIKKALLTLNKKLNMRFDKEEYLNNYLTNYYNDTFIHQKIHEYFLYIKEEINSLEDIIKRLANYVDYDFIEEIDVLIKPLRESISYDELNKLDKISLPRIPKGSGEEAKAIKEELKKKLDSIYLLISDDYDTLKRSILNTKPYIKTIIDIILKLDNKVNEYKYTNNLFDFNDISKLAIKIVKENENIREELKNYFKEIMIDEYQDTNDLQEIFISLISNNNVYMVGDIKQSIYRFRNANPLIFKNKYDNYSNNDGGIKIDLLKNFRSREEVLNNINLIFGYLMDDKIGGADYVKSHQMLFGNTSYNIEGKTKENNDMEIYLYDYNKELGYKKEEIEAFFIANDIKEKVCNHYPIFDKDNKILREANYSDFAILIDRTTSFDLYKKIFLYEEIPLNIYKDEKLTQGDLLLVIKNIYKLLDILVNKKSIKELEYVYLSIGRSFLYEYPDEYLLDVISTNNYYEDDILKKALKIKEGIENKSISNILDEIIIEYDLYNKLIKTNNLKENEIKIDYLYSLSSNLSNMMYTYEDFCNLLDEVINNDSDIKFSTKEKDSNSVKIMTIHKSKGLEYPICYFPGLTPKFNSSDLKDKFIYDNKLGIISPYYEEGIGKTFYYDLYKKNYYEEEISEKIRLFYVALTRVKEKMIFILPNDELEEEYNKNNVIIDSKRINIRNFSTMLMLIKSKLNDYVKTVDFNKINLNKDYKLNSKKELLKNLNNAEKINIINYPKYDKKEIETSHFSKNKLDLIDPETKKKLEFGTKMHYYLEIVDFKNPNYLDIPTFFVDKIKKFLNNKELSNIKDAKIYKEYEFIDNSDNFIKHGIIDLMLEYQEHIDIIDYKLKDIDDDNYLKQLNGYKEYISNLINKPVNIYLYSIMNDELKKI